MSTVDKYNFIAEWYEPNAGLKRKFLLSYYADSDIEMVDQKSRRMFLKKSKSNGLSVSDLYIGARVTINSRQLDIIGYGDIYTGNRLQSKNEKTFAMVKPDAMGQQNIGHIIKIIYDKGFHICNMKMVRLLRENAEQFYSEHRSKPFFNTLITFMTSGPVLALELKRESAVDHWRSIIGPTDSNRARAEDPSLLRAQFGTDKTKNAFHGSDSDKSAQIEIDFFFKSELPSTAVCSNSTLCIIKPHAVIKGRAGDILVAIEREGFQITALQIFNLITANAEEFFEVYKEVVEGYKQMVTELCSGPCIVAEICGLGRGDQTFRDFVGPSDPEVADKLRPGTLRAIFGQDKIKNAVHCTDLPEDGPLEVEYFFKILNSSQ